MPRTPNTNSPQEVRRAIADLLTSVDGITQVTIGNWNNTYNIVSAGAAHWDEAYNRELHLDAQLKCLTTNIQKGEQMTTQYRVAELSTFPWQQQVLSQLATQPTSPAKGDRYLVIATATGTQWTGQEGKIAWCDTAGTPGHWTFDTPTAGMKLWSTADVTYLHYNGSSWAVDGATHTQNTDTGTTSSSFQIDSGNTGPKIVNDSGTMKITTSDGTTKTPVEVSAITDGTNSTTPAQIKSAYSGMAAYDAGLKCITFNL